MIQIIRSRHMGLCGGVTRAVSIVRDLSRDVNRCSRIILLGELVHNPQINAELEAAVAIFFAPDDAGLFRLDTIRKEDIIVIPAFGAAEKTYDALKFAGCRMVDTTCASVVRVRKAVESYRAQGRTTLFFGKRGHQETEATVSFAGHYLIFSSEEDVHMLIAFFSGKATANDLSRQFFGRCSSGFDCDIHLQDIGLAAQTTMLKDLTVRYFSSLEEAFLRYPGHGSLTKQDTICGATQIRQDAVRELAANVDLLIIVGGFNSSNTANLAKVGASVLGEQNVFHVDGDKGSLTSASIIHLPVGAKEAVMRQDWLPLKDSLRIGITSGASTPDEVVDHISCLVSGFNS